MPLLALSRPVPARVGLDVVKTLFTPSLRSTHLFVWATVFGTVVWQSSIGAYAAFQALPRRDFGRLQGKLFPVYALLSGDGTWLLALTFAAVHHGRILKADSLAEPTVLQTLLLTSAAVAQAVNHLVVGKRATQTMYKRHALEAAEGKDYSDPTASPQMKELSKQFSKLHGTSSLLNLAVVVAITVQGFWLSNFGL